jgi:pyruvate dehydrogenase E2 component (dihydrolipoamide acetyltransferase)
VALTPMRAAIARQMTRAKQSVPHFYVSAEIDTEAVTAAAAAAGVGMSAALIRATALTLVDEPGFNAHWSEDGPVLDSDVNVGVAIAVPGGLMAPAILGCDRLSTAEIGVALRALAERTRAGRAKGSELTGGTFTLSNLGGHAVSSFMAIVNSPQVAILATGRSSERVAVVDGEPAVRRMMTATLSVDHRALDGADAGRFLDRLKARLEAPDWLA